MHLALSTLELTLLEVKAKNSFASSSSSLEFGIGKVMVIAIENTEIATVTAAADLSSDKVLHLFEFLLLWNEVL